VRTLTLTLLIFPLFAQDTVYRPDGETLPGPPSPAAFREWLADIVHWRNERLIRMGYDGAQYQRPELKWSQSNFVQPQMMVEDRYFYDPVQRRYTVDRYLDDLDRRYGGIDSVLIWPVYPNIGIDSRSQYDLIRDLPGGIAGIHAMIDDFHRRGVKVFFPVMPWDQGTNDPGMPNAQATARLLAEIGADGVNGDTFSGIPRAYRDASDATSRPLVLEPEGQLEADEMLAWNNQSWGYWKYSAIPGVSRYKWLEPRHMVNICRRWARDHTDDLQHAFFNGVGFESWENIWGIWNGLTPRDAEALRRIAMIERHYASFLTSPAWEPHTPVLQTGVYASKFPANGAILWTFVNRNEYAVIGPQIDAPAGYRYFDLWHGVELHAEHSRLSFEMEPNGYGAILVAKDADAAFLTRMHAFKPLADFSREWRAMPQRIVEIPRAASTQHDGMIHVPAGEFDFNVSGIEIEGGNSDGVDVQYPWEPSARRHHLHPMHIDSFWIDRTLVTNAQFAAFLRATGYHPADDHNFLRDWKDGKYPGGGANKPVTWVSLEDARAYARWAGKRLPHEWEWQYAAQGTDGRLYPWGSDWRPSAVPTVDRGRTMRPPDDVATHPQGASALGVQDLVGTLWQWTDEYQDERTRAGILRGGSYYQPEGSHWYFPQTYKLNEHGKYLLMSDGKDRSAGIGFRCVADE